MSNKRRFELKKRSIPADAVSDDVEKVQHYLVRFGYLSEAFKTKKLDEATQQALRRFQKFTHLQETGVIDPPTAEALEMPRCGAPDLSPAPADSDLLAGFKLAGCSYEAIFRDLTYAVIQGTADITGSQENQAIRNAFATWQAEIPIDFREVGATQNPIFKIGWYQGDHGDGNPFDGVGNVLAHAFYPPPCGGGHTGELHFDDAETWAFSAGPGKIDTQTVSLHEIGHLLGLAHTDVAGSVMSPYYTGQLRALQQDDINGIRALYGRRGPTLQVLVHLQDIGDKTYRENEFAGTRGQGRRLEGFQIKIAPKIQGLSMQYMAHVQGIGDIPWTQEGQFIGTRGQGRRLEGFAIQLTGSARTKFNVKYMAHLEGSGDTGFYQNGQFCGTRGQSRRVEGILVRVEPK